MSWNFEYAKLLAQKFAAAGFLDQKIRRNRFNFKAEAEVAEELRVGNHRLSIKMTTDGTGKSPLNFCDVADMVDVAMGQDQEF